MTLTTGGIFALDDKATVTNKQALVTGRAAAGAAYVTKVTTLMTTRIELGAYDLACRNTHMGTVNMLRHSAGFSLDGDFAFDFPMHNEYLRSIPGGGDISGRVYARHLQLIPALNGTDAAAVTMLSSRTTAGAAYAAALGDFIAAWVELQAFDWVCSSREFQEGKDSYTQSFYYRIAGSFNRPPALMAMVHTEFAPASSFMNERQIVDAANARRAQLVATIAS